MQDETHLYPSASIRINPAEIVETYISMCNAMGLDQARAEFAEVDRRMSCYHWWIEHVQRFVFKYFMDYESHLHEKQLDLARASAPKIYNMMPAKSDAESLPPSSPFSAPRPRKVTQSEEQGIRKALEQLLTAPYGNSGKPLFNIKSHWQAVYRILADMKFVRASDFDGFDDFIKPLIPYQYVTPKTTYSYASVKQISQTDFDCPFSEWKFDTETTNRRKPFARMQEVGRYFRHCLEENGVK